MCRVFVLVKIKLPLHIVSRSGIISKSCPEMGVLDQYFSPSMLSYNGSFPVLLVHAALWITSIVFIWGNHDTVVRSESTSGNVTSGNVNDIEAEAVYNWYFACTISAVGFLVVYEGIAYLNGYMLSEVIHGIIFGIGFAAIAFGSASIPYAIDAGKLNEVIASIVFLCLAMGMFVTFYIEFRLEQKEKKFG